MIYICIPALNEARTIGVLLWKIRQVMDEFPRDYHVLVLDDGSTDDTREVLEPYLRVLPVTVLRNERTLAGIEVGESGASARVTVGPGDPAPVDVRLELTLRYPATVRSVVDAVRVAVADDLCRLAGHRMRALAVTVTGLRSAAVPTRPRVQ